MPASEPEFLLQSGRTRARVAPARGGRIAQIEIHDGVGWLPLLHDADRSDPLAWGCYLMAPWPNRVAHGRFSFEGRAVTDLGGACRSPEGHAIHGLVFDRPWTVVERGRDTCVMTCSFAGLWPFTGSATQRVAVEDDTIALSVTLHAESEAYPAGAGWHPWFRRDVRPGGEARLRLEADGVYELSADMLPTGRLHPPSGDHALADGPALGTRRLDTCFAGVRTPMTVSWGDIELTMRSSLNVGHAVVYTPDHAFCVEPQTCAPDAFNLAARGASDTGLALVRPAAPLVASTRWTWRVG